MNEWTPANSHEDAARRIKTTCAAFERALNVDAYIAEIEHLEAINVELLAALGHIVQHQSAIAGTFAEFSGVVNIAKAAIANAQPQGD